MNPDVPRAVFVPPRPNLGPEPIPRSTDLLLPALIVLIVLLAAWVVARLIVRRRKARRLAGRALSQLLAVLEVVPDAPGDRLIAWSRIIREVLATRFGPAWAAKTTEEMEGDPILTDRLGADRAARVIDVLRMADRAKFADSLGPHRLGADADLEWLSETIRELLREVGARSRIKGR